MTSVKAKVDYKTMEVEGRLHGREWKGKIGQLWKHTK